MRALLATLLSTVFLAAPSRAELKSVPQGDLGAPGALPGALSPRSGAPDLPAFPDRLSSLGAGPGMGSPELPPPLIQREPALSPATSLDAPKNALEEYRGFLVRLGFEPYRERIAAALRREDLAPVQRKTLQASFRRLEALDAARELAARLMSSLEGQNYEAAAVERALDFTARMAALNPLDPPKRLPPELAQGSARDILRWLDEETARRIEAQTAAVTSDALWAAHGARGLKSRLDADPRVLASEAAAVKKQAEAVLRSRYTDVELGQTRFLPRALIACLLRYARRSGRPEIERDLEARLNALGLRISDFVGNRLELMDREGQERVFRVQTGDILGSRFRSRRASLIVYSARPHWTLWLKAFRAKLLGNVLGLWMKPSSGEPEQRSGPLRNALNRALHALRTRLAFQPWLLRGYAHVGIAWVREADGVSMAWAWENEVDSEAGGVRLVGLTDEFIKPGHHALFGLAHWGASEALREFRSQALNRGDGAAAQIQDQDASRFLAELQGKALRKIESFMADEGVAYDFKFAGGKSWATCISTLEHGFALGAAFDFQSKPDHWNPLAKVLRALGLAYKGLEMKGKALWLGSLFIDPKVALHWRVELPDKEQVYRGGDPYLMPSYEEIDPALTASLRELLAREGWSFASDRAALARALRVNLLGRRFRRGGSNWWNSFSLAVGYYAGLERLFRAAPRLHPRFNKFGT